MLELARELCELKNLGNERNKRETEWWNIKVGDLIKERL